MSDAVPMIRLSYELQNPELYGRPAIEAGPSTLRGQEPYSLPPSYSTWCEACGVDHGARWEPLTEEAR